ncbi:MAG: hypothetical protein Q9P01_05495 [Anaerolineae bacterium]|nr:hypothetical protein [Anaerolineae bacterium]
MLAEIVTRTAAVLSKNSLNPQQQTFLQHIHQTAQELHTIARDIPPTDYALHAIIPMLGDSFTQPQTVIFGYAKMLMEEPDSFGGAVLNSWQHEQVMTVYERGIALAQLTEKVTQDAFHEQQKQHNASPIIFDLNMHIWQNIPVYRYWLRDKAVKISANFPQGLPPVLCNPYHIAAIAQHIVLTMATELIEYGNIQISGTLREDSQAVMLNFFCTGIQLNDNVQYILFDKQGRYMYRERIISQRGTLHFSHEVGIGATVHIDLPLPSRATS